MSRQWFGVAGVAGVIEARTGFEVTRGVAGLVIRPTVLPGGTASTWVLFPVPSMCQAKVSTPGLEFDAYDNWPGPSAAVNLVGVRVIVSGASQQVCVDQVEVYDGEEPIVRLLGSSLGRDGRLVGQVDREFSIPARRIQFGVVVGVRGRWNNVAGLTCAGAGIMAERVDVP